ncbi:MAG TPA: cytochrome c-type biogenesis protein CcmH [Polyangiaceae bacterium]|nr:cytochrome c-type biogenesis protein CcmH [Polyangiaceae bacterium]
MAPWRIRFTAFVAAVLVFVPTLAFAQSDPEAPPEDPARYAPELQGYVPGAAALEGRIMAPCCWMQTIDIHGSEIANELRVEIRKRLRAGESADSIQASLVARYGERILAVPPGSPLKSVATLLALGLVGAGAGALVMLKRWRGRSLAPAGPAPVKLANDAQLDARLDAELRALDD